MPRPLLLVLVGIGCALGCGPGGARTPAGTTNDPVETCTRVADVCRFEGAKLGVCTQRRDGVLACVSQH